MYVPPESWKPSSGIALEGTALDVVKSTSSMSVLAGPGAGKTELLAQRASYLLNTGACPPPKRILAIAFKVDAARNLQERVEQRCEPHTAARFESLTLHGLAKRILDQFREALSPELRPTPNYQIMFPNRDTWAEFQQDVSTEVPNVKAFAANQLAELVHSKVPDDSTASFDEDERIRALWWDRSLKKTRSQITFDMVLLLARHIVSTKTIVKKAISDTYTHVFLDEFQDMTAKQYGLVSEIFCGSGTVVTAVGDSNQAIMGWAGALPRIFERFDREFGAENKRLLFNFRSNARIVALINDLSKLFADGELVATESARMSAPSPADAVEGWLYPSRDAEGAGIAGFISQSLASSGVLRAHDFVILTRLRANDVEERLAPHFEAHGLRLRNEARTIGPLSIQDLVEEHAFLYMTALLKMVHGVREGAPFQVARNFIAEVEDFDLSTEKGSALSLRLVQEKVSELGRFVDSIGPAKVDFAQVVGIGIPPNSLDRVSRAYREYLDREYLDGVLSAITKYFAECARRTEDWKTFLSATEGLDSVKIMTIHKSKGLEFNTVIFVELNDDAFWRNPDDLNVFFVALSRTRERIRFSLTEDSKGFRNVAQFIRALQEAGVHFQTL